MGIYEQFYFKPTKTIEVLSEIPSDQINIEALISGQPPFINRTDITTTAKRTLIIHGFDQKWWKENNLKLLKIRMYNLIEAGFTVLHHYQGKIKPFDLKNLDYENAFRFWDQTSAPDPKLLATLSNIPLDALFLLDEYVMALMVEEGDRSDWEHLAGLKHISLDMSPINMDGLNQLLLATGNTVETLNLSRCLNLAGTLSDAIHLPYLTELRMNSEIPNFALGIMGYSNIEPDSLRTLIQHSPNLKILQLPGMDDTTILSAIKKPEIITSLSMIGGHNSRIGELEKIAPKMQQLKILTLEHMDCQLPKVLQDSTRLEQLTLKFVEFNGLELGKVLSQSKHLKKLYIHTNKNLTDAITHELFLPDLEEIMLYFVNISTPSLEKILAHAKNIKKIELAYCSTDCNLNFDLNLSSLEILVLDHSNISAQSLQKILSRAHNLKNLSLSGCKNLQTPITLTQPLVHLEEFNASESNLAVSSLQQIFRGAHQLKEIRMNDGDPQAVLSAIDAPSLQHFIASIKVITLRDLSHFKANHPQLQTLSFIKCQQIISDQTEPLSTPPIDYLVLRQSTLPINQMLQYLTMIPAQNSLVESCTLNISSIPLSFQQFVIKKLEVHHTVFAEGTLQALLTCCGNIKKLTLNNCGGQLRLTKDSLDLTQLEELKLTSISIDHFSLLHWISQAPNLQELTIKDCDQIKPELLKNLKIPIIVYLGQDTSINLKIINSERAAQIFDADTRNDKKKTYKLTREFLGNPHTPSPRDIRHRSFNRMKLNLNARGIEDPFILDNKDDLQLEPIPDIDLARKTKPLYDAFKKAGKHHYLGRFKLHINHTWQPLPSLFPDEKLAQYYIPHSPNIEIFRSKRDDLFYIRLREGAPLQPEEVTMEILLSHQPSPGAYNALPDAVKNQVRFFRGFRDQALKVNPDDTAQTLLDAVIKTRNGACRHRAVAFKNVMQKEHPDIPVRLVSNECHIFPEVFYAKQWIRCDLGGYPAQLTINEKSFPEEHVGDDESNNNFENMDELYEQTFSANAKQHAPPDFFQKARNLTTLTLADYTSFLSIYNRKDLSMLDTVNISNSQIEAADFNELLKHAPNLKTLNLNNCKISAEAFNQLDFSMLKQLESVSITGRCIPNAAAFQRLMSTAPPTAQGLTDQDFPEVITNKQITLIEKPRKVPKNRYFPLQNDKKVTVDIPELLSADWRTGLINTKNVDQLRLAQQQYCIDHHRPNYYIHHPNELVCSAAYIERQGQYGAIKKGPGGPLHDFLNAGHKNPVIGVNFNHFRADHIARHNTLIDEQRKADGTPIPEDCKIVGFINSELPDAYQGSDFYSRFAYKHDFNQPIPTPNVSDAPSSVTQQTIELCGGSNWGARLIGHWELQDKKLFYKEGALVTAIKNGITQITLNNAPCDNPDFQRFLQDFNLHQGVYHKGRLLIAKPKNVSLTFSTEVGFPDKNQVLQFAGSPSTPGHVLNEASFSAFLGIYHCDNQTKNMLLTPGLIARHSNGILPVYLTGNLSVFQWMNLFEQCRLHHTVLQISLAANVTFPDELTPSVQQQRFRASEALHTQFVMQKNVSSDFERNAIVIDISEVKPSDLLPTISSKLDQDKLAFEFSEKYGFLNTALTENTTVILKGSWSKELSEAIHPLLMSRLQANQTSGKLILLSMQPEQFPFMSTTQMPAVIQTERKTIHLDAQYEERYPQVESALRQSPFVLLSGATGVGKTHFIYHDWKKHHPACHIGEDQILAWINDKSPGIKTLFIDEANITQRQWSEFEGLFHTPPSIFYKGKHYPLSPEHKVIFAANPLNYGGERQTPQLFRDHPCDVTFHPLPPSVIEASLELPSHIAQPIVELVTYLTHLNANDTIMTPREIIMMACLTKTAMVTHPNEDPIELAKFFAYHLSKAHVPTERLNEFNARFTPKTTIHTPSVPLKDFVINKTNQEALDTLNHHLNLRQLRLQKTSNIPNNGGLGGVIIEGEPGIGKSELVMQLLQARGLKADVDYFHIPASMSTEDKETRLQEIFHAGKIAVIDEINSAPMMERVLNALLEGRDLNGNPADNPGFMLIGTQNPISFKGRMKTTLPLKHRLQTICMPNYGKDEMLGIIRHLGIPPRISKDMVAEFELNQQKDNKLCFRDLIKSAQRWLKSHENAQEIKIDLAAMPQIGALCKTVAIANVESYFSKQLQYNPIPLWSRKQDTPSIRKLVKEQGSIQGEILEFQRWEKSANQLGFSTKIIDFTDNINCFVETVKTHLAAGNLPLIGFAVVRDVGQPDPDPIEPHEVEHAAIITGYNPMTDEMTLAHWGKTYTVDIVDLFNSNHALPETRTQESYFKNPEYRSADKDMSRKYLLDKTGGKNNRIHSIIPAEKTGFKGKLLVVNKPEKSELLNTRDACFKSKSHFFKPGSRTNAEPNPASRLECS